MRKIKSIFSILLGVTFLASSVVIVGIASPQQAFRQMAGGETVDPFNALVAAALVSVVGIVIFYIRNRKNKQERKRSYYLQSRLEQDRKEEYRESAF